MEEYISRFLDYVGDSEKATILISSFFAVIPIIIWLKIFFNKKEKGRKIIGLIFLLGCLTAPALLGIQYLWEGTRFNLEVLIEKSFKNEIMKWSAIFILFAAMEEIIKLYVVKFVDQSTTLITKVNDAVKYSIVSALGFSFIENIWYLYNFWPMVGTIVISEKDFISMYIFRSLFTTCAHMVFSGIFGYFYGVGKFSITMVEEKKLTGTTSFITKFVSKIFKLPLDKGFRQRIVMKGLLLAVLIHATFNFLLQYNVTIPVLIFVICGYIYLKFLLGRKAGNLILLPTSEKKRKSSMNKKDEDVVLELMGMWFTEKKYVDVMHMCQRLLERDPDNNVIKLFKAKAVDKMDEEDPYKQIIDTVLLSDLSEKQQNVIDTYTQEKEMFQKVKRMIKKEIEKQNNEKKEFKKAQDKIKEMLKEQQKKQQE